MPDDLAKRGKPGRDRINVHEDHELRNWAQKLGVSARQVKEAVQAVGDRAEKVRDHLREGKGPKRASDIIK